MTRRSRAFLGLALALVLMSARAPARAQEQSQAEVPLPGARPVPRVQAIPQPYDQVSIQVDGREWTRYHFGPGLRRPFLFPVVGASGRSLTRMGHPHDPVTHSHHNSVWISHHDVGGLSFWDDRGPGRIVHRRVLRLDDGDDAASVSVENAWVVEDVVFLLERRRMTVRPVEGRDWLLLIDLELSAPGSARTLGKTPFGLVGVRMAKTIGVHDGGGLIRNSEGKAGEKGENGVFWKPARWVDYSGPIAPGANEGIALFDHPRNPNHPSVFHVRDDGWMGASLTFHGPRTIEPGAPLRLRYGLYVHSGVPAAGAIDARWKAFAALPVERIPETP